MPAAPARPPLLPLGQHVIPTWAGLPPVHARESGTAPSSSQPPRRGPRNSFPSTSAATSTTSISSVRAASGVFSGNAAILVAVYPLVAPGIHEIPGHPTCPLVLYNEDVLDYINRFDMHGLLLTLHIPRQGLVLPITFTTQLTSALAAKGLELPPVPHHISPADAEQLHKQPYCLLSPTRRATLYKFATHSGINANNFGIAEFGRLNKKVPDPLPADGTPTPLIFIGEASFAF
ncbi:hypothetical protein B0H10DRAFT_2443794 [Mycena sp. CBHHK59/15]|nr:hypothetical protein B0H10DRAFT_2443794 [Mycena sp. CBHHK59/15]